MSLDDKPDAVKPTLLPCPFCGHAPRWSELLRGDAWGSHKYQIICSSSHCCASVELPSDLVEKDNGAWLARMWNRRHSVASAIEAPSVDTVGRVLLAIDRMLDSCEEDMKEAIENRLGIGDKAMVQGEIKGLRSCRLLIERNLQTQRPEAREGSDAD